MANTCYIGSVTFTYPLKWIGKGDVVVLGSDTRTRSGNLVMLRGVASQQYVEVKLLFEWATYSQVTALKQLWKSGATVAADIEASGTTVNLTFAAKNGVANVKHAAWGDDSVHHDVQGQATDIYNGELNVIIITGESP